MSNTLVGLIKDCSTNLGGVTKIKIMKVTDITAITVSNYEVSAMTVSSNPVEYVIPQNSTSYNVTLTTDNETGIQEWNHSVDFRINKRLKTKHTELLKFGNGNPDLAIFVKDRNSTWWLLGLTVIKNLTTPYGGMLLSSNTGGSGTNKADGSHYQLAFVGTCKNPELQVSSSVVTSLSL